MNAARTLRAGLARSFMSRIMRALLIILLVGFFVVRYAVRQYARKELFDPAQLGAGGGKAGMRRAGGDREPRSPPTPVEWAYTVSGQVFRYSSVVPPAGGPGQRNWR